MTGKNMKEHSRTFNNFRNIEKAINSLKGILSGLTADRKLNEHEVLFLDVWLKSQEHLHEDGDVIDLLDLTCDILRDGIIEQEELDDLNELCVDILSYKKAFTYEAEGVINEFLGVLQGVTADGVVNIKEFDFVSSWIKSHSDLKSTWPIDVVQKRILEITEDNHVSDAELADFAETMKLVTGSRFDETGSADGSATEFLQDEITELNFERAFCFTGKFVSGSRKTIEKAAAERGATLKDNISQQVDYLVIGSVASRDWMFTSHGRKIESAVKLRNEGHNIKIITEKRWLELVTTKASRS